MVDEPAADSDISPTADPHPKAAPAVAVAELTRGSDAAAAAAVATTPDPPIADTDAADADETVPVASASRIATASTVPSGTAVPATATAAQLVSAPPVLPAPASPAGVVSGLVSGLLAWVGLSPGLSNAPVAPTQSPLLWGLLEWARRQVRHTFFNRTPTTAYNPAENSRSVDGVITGDLHAVDPDGDPLTFTVTRAPERGSVVVNSDGTFTYTPNDEFVRTGGIDTFSIVVDDGAAYRLPGVVGLIQDLVHRGAVGIGLSGSDTIDSHPEVAVNPVKATIDVADNPVAVAVTPDGSTAYVVHRDFSGTVSVVNTGTNTVIDTITVGDGPNGLNSVAISPDGATAYVANFSDNTVVVIDTATNTVIDTITVGVNPREVAVRPDGNPRLRHQL